jgi:hypothetical protein
MGQNEAQLPRGSALWILNLSAALVLLADLLRQRTTEWLPSVVFGVLVLLITTGWLTVRMERRDL